MADKTEAEIAADAARKDADAGTLLKTAIDAITACSSKVDALGARMDAYESKDDAARKDAARKDAEEKEKEEKEKAEREDAARKDAERKDAERKDAARKDESPEEKEKREKEERDDAARKDAARKDAEEKEEKEKKEREDAARKDRARDDSAKTVEQLQAQVNDMNARMPKPFSDADFYAVSDAQSRADEVYIALGQRAPIPRQAETVDMYERRVVRDLKQHSSRWKDLADTSTGVFADSAAFNNVRDQVYADAKAFGLNPANISPGQLREKIHNQGGHEFHEFYGRPNDWMDDFSGHVQLKAEGKWQHDFSGRN